MKGMAAVKDEEKNTLLGGSRVKRQSSYKIDGESNEIIFIRHSRNGSYFYISSSFSSLAAYGAHNKEPGERGTITRSPG